MNSVNLFNRLSYMLEESSINSIVVDTGIPYTTLYEFSKQRRNLPSKYENVLYNAYSRDVYSRMRNLGYDTRQATLMRYKAPEFFHMRVASHAEKIELYTYFNVQRKFPDRKLTMKQAVESPYWKYYESSITKSIKQREKWLERHPEGEYKYAQES